MLTGRVIKIRIAHDDGYQIFKIKSLKSERYQKEIIKFIKSEKTKQLESETFTQGSLMADWLYQAIISKKPIERHYAGIPYIIEEYPFLTERINRLLKI